MFDESENFKIKSRMFNNKLLAALSFVFSAFAVSALPSCSNFWAYQSEGGEKIGLIKIPNPNQSRVDLKAYFSINTKIQSVSRK